MRAQLLINLFFFMFLLRSSNSMSSQPILTVSSNQTIVSPRKIFELGFFRFEEFYSGRFYLGIWHKDDPKRASLWVANRDTHVGPKGALVFSDNNLMLLDDNGSRVWTTNLARGGVRSPMVTKLLDDGNLVVTNSNYPDRFLWQSFAFPTDTLLSQMKLGTNRVLRSWKYPDDPSTTDFFLELKNQAGIFELFIWDGIRFGHLSPVISSMYRSDPWDGIRFGHLSPEILHLDYTNSEDSLLMIGQNNSRLTISRWGTADEVLKLYTWVPESKSWNLSWSPLSEDCNHYALCGPYGYCSPHTTTLCNCIKGFDIISQKDWSRGEWSDGCKRRTRLSCHGDKFWRLQKMKLPDTKYATVEMELGPKECEKRCAESCNCTAFAHVGIQKHMRGCVIWTRELKDLRNYTVGGEELYVKVAAVDHEEETKKDSRNTLGTILPIIGGVLVIIVLVSISFYLWKRRKRNVLITVPPTQEELMLEEITETERFVVMELSVIAEATDNFSNSNKLGQGGFGTVYKGTLPDGKDIAVKRLKAMSSQGVNEFMNEVALILRVRHVNLVRLQGCCCEGNEKLLIYEYLENSCLSRYLFDKTQSSLLNWHKRFNIVKGIAEGLSYLHNFTTPPILHKDLKPSNVLLDRDMIPKISDFGLAETLEIGKTEAETDIVAGTYGYMSPEYALHRTMSEKSDVFSYGVMLLEIITGVRNVEFCISNPGDSLLDHVWRQWNEGRGMRLLDSNFVDGSLVGDEVLRSIQIGLLCVEQHVDDRPNTRSVVFMLEDMKHAIPTPKPPKYYYIKSLLGETACEDAQSTSVNYITLSRLDSR